MKKLLLFLSLMMTSLMMASHAHAKGGCGTVADEKAFQYVQRKLAQGGWNESDIGRDGLPKICIPITCHIVRTSLGTGGIPEDRVDLAIEDLNLDMASVNMEFFRDGDFIFLDSAQFVQTTEAERDLLREQGPVEGTINIWFVPDLVGLCGESSFTFTDVQGILMDNDCTSVPGNRTTFSHEVGHYFNLFHTHEPFFGLECVDGSNCDEAGDTICDTPADFDLGAPCSDGSDPVDAQCVLTPDCQIDPCNSGLPYDPLIDNIMSYSTKRCRSLFTAGQLNRARAVAVDERADPTIDGYIDYPDCLVTESGACCNSSEGTCFDVVNSGLCTQVNSNNTFMGAGTSCNTLVCTLPDEEQGACCIGDDCQLVSGFAECVSLSGAYIGDNEDCTDTTCTGLPGGCCLVDQCEIKSEEQCASISGTFLGPNSVCSSGICATVTPYVPVSPYNFPQTGPEDLEPDGYAGNAVDVEGPLLLIGAMGEESSGLSNAGAAYIFNLVGTGEQLKRLTPSAPYQAAGDFFGGSVDLDLSDGFGTAIVGAYRHDYEGTPSQTDAGMAFVFESPSWSNGSTTESYVIENPSQYRSPFDYFGFDVAIGRPASGMTAIIGAPRANVGGPDTGAVYWSSSPFAPRTTSRVDLQGLFGSRAPSSFDYCGESVAMCVVGSLAWAAMGAPGYDNGDNFNSGSVYLVKQRRGPVIGPNQPRLDPYLIPNHRPDLFKQFGRSVDLYDDNGTPYLIVGALVREGLNDTGTQGSGIAFVYKYSNLANKWTRMNPALVPLDTQPLYDNCAESVSLTRHNGHLLAVIGCPSANVDTLVSPGMAFLYVEDGGEWFYVNEIIAFDRQEGDSFGYAVAIDDYLAIGAPNSGLGNSGKVYVNPVPPIDSRPGGTPDRSSNDEPIDPADLGSDTMGIGHADGVIGLADVRAVIDVWGDCDHGCDYLDCHGDLNGDCRVDSADLLIVLSKWND